MTARAAKLGLRYLALALALVLLNFLIPRLLPGSPLSFSGAGAGMNQAVPLPASARAKLGEGYQLDRPLDVQLETYLRDLVHGDLGWSIARSAPVATLIVQRLPWTLGLMLSALIVAALLGTTLGVLAGWRQRRGTEGLLVSLGAGLSAVPEFLVAIGLLAAFSVGLGWFPLSGGHTVFAHYGVGVSGGFRQVADVARHLVLPCCALALVGLASFILFTHDAIAGIAREPWLLVARAKGLTESRAVLRHALPNLALPLLTFFGLRLGAVLGGALVVERVFNVPGLGLLAYQSVLARDYPVLQGEFLLTGLGVLVANFAVELVYLAFERRAGPSHV